MIELEEIPTQFVSDHLFLLVGMNPLPNYVAARLLATKGGNIYLLHTAQTGKIARQITNVLKTNIGAKTLLFEIDSADSAQIRCEVKAIVARLTKRGLDTQRSSVGLNYTGGTAAMSVHVYHALEQAIPGIVCSYLDARTLSLRFDGRGGEQTRAVSVGTALAVSFDELAILHGYRSFASQAIEPTLDPRRKAVVRAILEVNLTEPGRDSWVRYVNAQPMMPCPDTETYPELQEYADKVREIFGPTPDPRELARLLGSKESLAPYKSWFQGTWLEEYALTTIKSSASGLNIGHLAMGLEPTGSRQFELDVAAMRGYQLFAVSCQAGKMSGRGVKAHYKEHLLEIYVRARQLGGDEARIALVCRFEDAEGLEQELRESWFTEESVRVFGINDLPDLADHFRNWFENANR